MKKFLKKISKKLSSRKFQAWIVATLLLQVGKITSNDWVIITGIYIGINLIQKAIERNNENI